MKDQHDASGSFLGYLYQCRFALYCAIQKGKVDPDLFVSIEKFDDISFESSENPVELIQTKHHTTTKNLSNSSEDFWKTIDIWMKRQRSQSDKISFFLITNSTASTDSIAQYLRFGKEFRNVSKAILEIEKTGGKTKNDTIKSIYLSYQRMSPLEKQSFVSQIFVFDNAADILEIENEIKKEFLTTIRPSFHDPVFERLEGWWLKNVISHLSGTSTSLIPIKSIHDKIYGLLDQFKPDSLPDDFWDWEGDEISDDHSNKIFVKQLQLIALHERRIRHAIRDYYRAFYQRSKWAREDLLIDDEIEKYEKKLIEEWTRYRDRLLDRLNPSASENDRKKFGEDLYNWVEWDADIKIRPSISSNYIMRGSFQILSDGLKIGWHPDFIDKLRSALKPA